MTYCQVTSATYAPIPSAFGHQEEDATKEISEKIGASSNFTGRDSSCEKAKGEVVRGPQVQSPRSSPGRSARKDMRSAGRSGQAEKGRVKGEAHVNGESEERERKPSTSL